MIDDLNQIDDVLTNVSKDQYLELKRNAEQLAAKCVCSGVLYEDGISQVEALANKNN